MFRSFLSRRVLHLSVLLALFLCNLLIYPVLAVEYNPGVSVGQYVKYGNFVVAPSPPVNFGWMKIEVTAVSGKEITLLTSGQFENGTAIPTSGNTLTYNIETGKMNGTTDYTYGPIIAGNLNEGDPVPPLSYGFKVNNTETKTYLGVSRTVNIIETTYSDANYDNHWILTYDKISGIMLESSFEVTQKSPTPTTTKASYSVTETNVFAAPTPTPSPTPSPTPTPPITPSPAPTVLPTPTGPTPIPTSTPTPTGPTPAPTPVPTSGAAYPIEWIVAIVAAIVIVIVVVALILRRRK